MKTDRPTDARRRRYERLTARLAKTGLILQGTIMERTIVRTPPNAPRHKKAYGPYYQWTWKHDGRTVTVNLTRAQARAYQKAIDNHRKLERLTREMRALSLAILEATTPSVKRRKARMPPRRP